ncbi:hypothetical protein [Erwinia tracheiphila]|uniref:Uncharacterized protein n=1 Tax=Erwinia tracheiphila TaxID=65700 RepID=A0A345CVW6_9GAMM|nr:hypothetical protein [Erwinia tracheiphila]AXF77583.1 hypothetical protein AV903_18535 [Erwinia tracheiphila]
MNPSGYAGRPHAKKAAARHALRAAFLSNVCQAEPLPAFCVFEVKRGIGAGDVQAGDKSGSVSSRTCQFIAVAADTVQ